MTHQQYTANLSFYGEVAATAQTLEAQSGSEQWCYVGMHGGPRSWSAEQVTASEGGMDLYFHLSASLYASGAPWPLPSPPRVLPSLRLLGRGVCGIQRAFHSFVHDRGRVDICPVLRETFLCHGHGKGESLKHQNWFPDPAWMILIWTKLSARMLGEVSAAHEKLKYCSANF